MALPFQRDEIACESCGYVGSAKVKNRVNGFIAIILLLFFIIPGVIYILWGLNATFNICPKCNNDKVIPTNTPKGKKLKEEYGLTNPPSVDTTPENLPPVSLLGRIERNKEIFTILFLLNLFAK